MWKYRRDWLVVWKAKWETELIMSYSGSVAHHEPLYLQCNLILVQSQTRNTDGLLQ